MNVGDDSLPDTINPNNFPAKLWRLVNNPANKAIYWDSLGQRDHPELVASLRRLTVDNKAKMQAGLNVNCRPPSRYMRVSGGGDSKGVKR
ncbi:hypothetical protein INR49_015019, partial [Caranx melampygus]